MIFEILVKDEETDICKRMDKSSAVKAQVVAALEAAGLNVEIRTHDPTFSTFKQLDQELNYDACIGAG